MNTLASKTVSSPSLVMVKEISAAWPKDKLVGLDITENLPESEIGDTPDLIVFDC